MHRFQLYVSARFTTCPPLGLLVLAPLRLARRVHCVHVPTDRSWGVVTRAVLPFAGAGWLMTSRKRDGMPDIPENSIPPIHQGAHALNFPPFSVSRLVGPVPPAQLLRTYGMTMMDGPRIHPIHAYVWNGREMDELMGPIHCLGSPRWGKLLDIAFSIRWIVAHSDLPATPIRHY